MIFSINEEGNAMSKNVLMLAGDAVEALEVMYPYYRLLEEGCRVTIAARRRRSCRPLSMTLPGGIHTKRSPAICCRRMRLSMK